MEKRREEQEAGYDGAGRRAPSPGASRFVFGAFWAILFVFNLLVSGPWAGFHGVLLGFVGLLMALRPPVVSLPRTWWILAVSFMVAGASSFLPASWIEQPGWRRLFEQVGIATGPLIVIQVRHAAEAFALFLIMLFVGLWLAGHRPSSSQLRNWSLAFTLGVAVYAILARMSQENSLHGTVEHFGFFPNRNHTATYLAMGSICGLGCVVQAMREKRFAVLAIALVATGICLWAAMAWSVSRAGVVLLAVGCASLLPMLGRRYLGRHGLWAIGLTALAAVGLFLIADSGVKQRISKTAEKAGSLMVPADGLPAADDTRPSVEGKPEIERVHDLDFRIPTALDTLSLIRDFKWTGIGAGQYYYLFPQYRALTAVANDSSNYHPESDWLWMASEAGIPATLALAALVGFACWKSLVSILRGRDRALRGACLVAALLVPIHGIFDVPGHRITLAWSAALLFALSLRSPSENGREHSIPSAWPFRLVALVLLAASVFLIRAQWWNGSQPALTSAKAALTEAQQLYQQDQAAQKEAQRSSSGEKYQPTPGEDILEKAQATLEQAEKITPLDRAIRRYQGFLALHFEGQQESVRKAFQIERTLDPTWVKAPLEQAYFWSNGDLDETTHLWNEALRRAHWLDLQHPGSPWSEARTREWIREQVRSQPVLEQLRKDRLGK